MKIKLYFKISNASGRLLPMGRKKGDACLSKNLQKAKIIR